MLRDLRTAKGRTMDPIPQPPAILVVDDDPDMLAWLKLFMHQLAPTYDFLTASDAHSALRQLARRTVPLLITDYLMPGMDGLQLTAAVKAASPMTHVILATAYGSAALEQRAREQHVDTFLPKAALFDRLEDVVRSILQLGSLRNDDRRILLASASAPFTRAQSDTHRAA
jgi:two-component system response regulator (stage 0 sporulation protein F)